MVQAEKTKPKSGPKSSSNIIASHQVIVIGCGHSGVINGVKLKANNIDDFVILEAADRVGGCWRDNTYPGCACDVPSAFYSYSFRANPNWSHTFAGQAEIRDYIEDTVNEMGLAPHLRLNTKLIQAQWLKHDKCWKLRTNKGEYRAQFVVFATGPLTKANTPSLPGLAEFPGEIFHSAEWNHDYDLAGKRVAVVGTGASSAQFVPEIQKIAKHVTIFQRTAPWVLPRPFARNISELEKAINRHSPILQYLSRRRIELLLVAVNYALTHPWVMNTLEPYVKRILKKQVPDKNLRDKITADFTLGCKRIIFSNDYYAAIKRKNVDLIASALEEVKGNRVIAANGESAEVDAIIFGTGFEITPPPIATKIKSADGHFLAERWKSEGPQAYLGTTIYDTPNAFFMVGPNILVYSSFIEIAEWQAAYIVDAIKSLSKRGIQQFNLLKEVSDEYNQRIQELLTDTVWNSGGCNSYYLGEDGRNIASWPWAIPKLKRKLSQFDLVNYQISR
ncbi:MAG: NAD(P)/FAD-dependent oxidoreductase [Pseudomonadales bacterium]|nr:NAD(P)/FAD-dependent oxidoreductase [Pseudomonadales bacterium]